MSKVKAPAIPAFEPGQLVRTVGIAAAYNGLVGEIRRVEDRELTRHAWNGDIIVDGHELRYWVAFDVGDLLARDHLKPGGGWVSGLDLKEHQIEKA